MLWFSLQHLSEIFLIIRRNERGITNVCKSSCKYPFFLLHVNEIEFSRNIFEKYSKFHENPSSGSQVVSCGRTDIRTDMTKTIVAFRNFVNARNDWGSSYSDKIVTGPSRGDWMTVVSAPRQICVAQAVPAWQVTGWPLPSPRYYSAWSHRVRHTTVNLHVRLVNPLPPPTSPPLANTHWYLYWQLRQSSYVHDCRMNAGNKGKCNIFVVD
jgi:hypothetical protein